MEVLASALRGRELYRLLTSIIVPRPIAWVGTRSVQGVDNLAPFSFFMGVSSKPPAVAISVARAGRDRLKHTARNILDTGVFTVSIPSVHHLEKVAGTAAQYPEAVSELEQCGLVAFLLHMAFADPEISVTFAFRVGAFVVPLSLSSPARTCYFGHNSAEHQQLRPYGQQL